MRNALEDAVRGIYADLRQQHPQFCACAHCQDDVLTLALNNTHPRYTTGSALGRALTSLEMQRDQMRAELSVIVFDAMRRVASNPRHAAPPAPPAPGEGEAGR